MAHDKRYKRVIVWMRRAFRVQDNAALFSAVQDADEVVPVLCLSRNQRYTSDTPRRIFVRSAILSLDEHLRLLGSQLYALKGDIVEELPRFAKRLGADAVYAVDAYDPKSLARDERLRQALLRMGIVLQLFKDRVLFEKQEILNQAQRPFRVFTPYKTTWLSHIETLPHVLPALRRVNSPPNADDAFSLSSLRGFSTVSEKKAEVEVQRQLRQFIKHKASMYKERRDQPADDGTSRLSAALSVGLISVRQVFWAAANAKRNTSVSARQNIDTFISELIWREFYYQILANFSHVTECSFKDEFAALRWSENVNDFSVWCEGRTGYPIVDAGMRQLVQEGWMHNRVRMIVASFLTKDLHISWQWGENFFFNHLSDADIASNNGGWQWAAGTGTDPSPWFRIFNPVSQGQRFDPQGAYVRKYVPELKSVPAKYIHSPWTMDRQQQIAAGLIIGRDYPKPIVDHAAEREITMALYQQAVERRSTPKQEVSQFSLLLLP